MKIESGKAFGAENTLPIFDEVQEVPKALAALKYFCEEAPEYAIVAAGSLLGVALHQGTSFPVGKVDLFKSVSSQLQRVFDGGGREGTCIAFRERRS